MHVTFAEERDLSVELACRICLVLSMFVVASAPSRQQHVVKNAVGSILCGPSASQLRLKSNAAVAKGAQMRAKSREKQSAYCSILCTYMRCPVAEMMCLQLPLAIQAGPNHPSNPNAPPRTHDIAFNPFHRPGQRTYTGWKVPNLVNGFSLVVVDGPPLNTPEYFRKVLFRKRT